VKSLKHKIINPLRKAYNAGKINNKSVNYLIDFDYAKSNKTAKMYQLRSQMLLKVYGAL